MLFKHHHIDAPQFKKKYCIILDIYTIANFAPAITIIYKSLPIYVIIILQYTHRNEMTGGNGLVYFYFYP